jgi:hypothetical protein
MRRRELLTGAGALAAYRALPAHGAIIGDRRALIGRRPPIFSLVSAGASSFFSASPDGKVFSSAATFPGVAGAGDILCSVCLPSVGRIAALSGGGNGFYAPLDAASWVAAPNYPTPDHWNQAVYVSAKNWLCAIAGPTGGSKNIALSSDANIFSVAASLSASVRWRSMDYSLALGSGFGRLVAVGPSVCNWSDDGGQSWTAGTIAAGTWTCVKWIPFLDIWLATSNTTTYATSTDGKIFTNAGSALPAQPSLNINAIAFSSNLGIVVIVTSGAAALVSPDAATWNSFTLPATMTGLVRSEALGLFVAYSSTGPTANSSNAQLWASGTALANDNWGSLVVTG